MSITSQCIFSIFNDGKLSVRVLVREIELDFPGYDGITKKPKIKIWIDDDDHNPYTYEMEPCFADGGFIQRSASTEEEAIKLAKDAVSLRLLSLTKEPSDRIFKDK